MKTRGGKTRAGVLKITTATPGVDVPNQEHEPEDPGEMEIESVVVLPDIPYLPRPRKRPYSKVHKGKIYPILLHSLNCFPLNGKLFGFFNGSSTS